VAGSPVDGQCLLGVVFTANDSVEFIAEDTDVAGVVLDLVHAQFVRAA
jgi:hypothetical protein